MSFIVQIIDAALPSDDTQRQRLIDRLVEDSDANDTEPGPALGQLYHQLVAHYPCLSSYKEDALDECVWGDGPLLGNFGQRIATVNIAHSEEQVLAFILKLAGDLSLKVIDLQSDLVYYPKSQEALDFIAAYEKPVIQEKPLTEKRVVDYLVARLTPMYAPLGFVWNKKEKLLQRELAYGTQCCWISAEKQRGGYGISFCVRFYITRVNEIEKQLIACTGSESFLLCELNFFGGKKRYYSALNFSELEQIVNELEFMVQEKILPFFEATLDLKELNAALNNQYGVQFFYGGLESQVLTLAYLVEPSKIHEIADLYRNCNISNNYYAGRLKVIDDIVSKLIDLNPSL